MTIKQNENNEDRNFRHTLNTILQIPTIFLACVGFAENLEIKILKTVK